MDKLLEAWDRKAIVQGDQINDKLIEHGKTWADVKQYLASNKKPQIGKGFIEKPIKPCPKCGGIMKLFSIESEYNKSKWECCKTCSKDPCGYVEYNTQTVEEIIGMEE